MLTKIILTTIWTLAVASISFIVLAIKHDGGHINDDKWKKISSIIQLILIVGFIVLFINIGIGIWI